MRGEGSWHPLVQVPRRDDPRGEHAVGGEDEDRADWDSEWAKAPLQLDRVLREEKTPRWLQIERAVLKRFGTFEDLRVIEIGSGHGTNALHFAKRGARVTLFDNSPHALEGGQELARMMGVQVEVTLGDLFNPDPSLQDKFDVSCSFGLCEHFLGAERLDVVAAHFRFIHPGGVAAIGVPNRWSFPYRIWMGILKRNGTWPLGTEVPFTRREMLELVERARGDTLFTGYGSFAGSLVEYLVNPFFHKAGKRGFAAPQLRTPLDRLAYELLVIAEPDSRKRG